MTTADRSRPAGRAAAARHAAPLATNQPDPRPVTEFTVAVGTVGINTVVTVTLDQPCVIRSPNWAFINNNDGSRSFAVAVTIPDNRTIAFQFLGPLASSIGTLEVPYQDMQVQNFQGGFVRPGGRWFRKAV